MNRTNTKQYRRAMHRNRNHTRHRDIARQPTPARPSASELDAEVEAERRARLALRPGGDLEGQGRLFEGEVAGDG
jgi:hypothetical protein